MKQYIDTIIEEAKLALPEQHKRQPWKIVNHGVGLLKSEDELNAYLASYGEMHKVKCYASFQNAPFKELEKNVFDIVDYGCGQGIATICFLEKLSERDLLNRVKKITLIEPSVYALGRAKNYIQNYLKTYPIEIETINQFLPECEESISKSSIRNKSNVIIDLFSNILDVPTIDLKSLAEIMISFGKEHYAFCMGPTNANSVRIDDFCNYLKIKDFFSNINDSTYSLTSDTHHTFGCKTRCFHLTTENKVVDYSYEEASCNPDLDADYNYYTQDNFKSNIYSLFTRLQEEFPEACVLYKPIINVDQPDLLVAIPNSGIWIINFTDETEPFEVVSYHKGDGSTTKEYNFYAYKRINYYQENLIKLHIEGLFGKVISNSKNFGLVHQCVVFNKLNSSDLHSDNFTKIYRIEDYDEEEHLIQTKHKRLYISAFGYDEIDNPRKLVKAYTNELFDDNLYNSFLNSIKTVWHTVSEGSTNIRLTREQENLLKTCPVKMSKVKGVAGGGKTLVMAHLAVSEHLRTGKKVLVLTFNITLRNYLRYRINQVPQEFNSNMFEITNYHQFIKAKANNYKVHLNNLECFDDVKLFEGCKDEIEKYSCILIDEIQDYEYSWQKIIKDYFLEPGGTFAVFGDVKQNIYQRETEDVQDDLFASKERQIKTVVPGKWIEKLSVGFRFHNPLLATLALKFQKTFFDFAHNIEIPQNVQSDMFCNIKYQNLKMYDSKIISDLIVKIIRGYNLPINQTSILSSTADILRDVDFVLRNQYQIVTKTTCETKEVFDKIIQNHKGYNYRVNEEIKEVRRNKKLHFTIDCEGLTLSTIHSFKGWEADTIILLVQNYGTNYGVRDDEAIPEIIYTGITRAKSNLFVINLGNEKYDDFFKQNIR